MGELARDHPSLPETVRTTLELFDAAFPEAAEQAGGKCQPSEMWEVVQGYKLYISDIR